jgi:hypothetical protein
MPIPTELFMTILGEIVADNETNAAAAAVRVWHTLFRKIAPLLGPLSADLLFARSLAANEAAFPWLPRIAADASRTALAEFERSLENRGRDDIVAANHALLSTYITVLADLIGAGLATRLLGGAFPDVETKKDTEE